LCHTCPGRPRAPGSLQNLCREHCVRGPTGLFTPGTTGTADAHSDARASALFNKRAVCDGNVHGNECGDSNRKCGFNQYRCSNRNTDHTDTDQHFNQGADGNADGCIKPVAYPNLYSRINQYTNANSNTNGNADTNQYTNANPNANYTSVYDGRRRYL
jgi:hypothetical protein